MKFRIILLIIYDYWFVKAKVIFVKIKEFWLEISN